MPSIFIWEVHDPITTVKFQPEPEGCSQKNILLVCTSTGRVCQYHVSTGQLLWKRREPDNKLFASCFLSDGGHFLTGGSDASIRIYDSQKKDVGRRIGPGDSVDLGHSSTIYSICAHPTDPNIFSSSGWDCCVNLWDLRSKQPAARVHGPYVCADSIDMSRDQPWQMVTGSRKTTDSLQLWDLRCVTSDGVKGKIPGKHRNASTGFEVHGKSSSLPNSKRSSLSVDPL